MIRQDKLKTLLIGMGKIGSGYADDPIMAKYYPYASHAQVLREHPAYNWEGVLDISDAALDLAEKKWSIPYCGKQAGDFPAKFKPDIAVISTPPNARAEFLEFFPSLRGIIVEKPLGTSLKDSMEFLEQCKKRNLVVQVNYWRRADHTFRSLAGGDLYKYIGTPQVIFGLYGNGLRNNGSHIIDLVRMLLGEVKAVRAETGFIPYPNGPIVGDMNFPFSIELAKNLIVMMQPINFSCYRENGLDIWGERGRMAILQEGLGIYLYHMTNNRSSQGDYEISSDKYTRIESTVGVALYNLYSNLADNLSSEKELWSPGESALQTMRVVEALYTSLECRGERIEIV